MKVTPHVLASPSYKTGYKIFIKCLFSSMLVGLFYLGYSTTLDQQAEQPLEDSFKRALITFGVVRSIDAIVSFAQGTEFAIEPFGLGVTLTPGEILDPVNDMIERFSWIVLAATTSLGIQLVLVGIGKTFIAQLVVVLATLVLFFYTWKPTTLRDKWQSIAVRLSFLVIFLRFLIPVVVLANEAVYASFLSDRYEESYALLEKSEKEAQALREEYEASTAYEAPDEHNNGIWGWTGRLKERFDQKTQGIIQSFKIRGRLREYRTQLANVSEQIINLIVVFVLQTLIFPLLFLWLGLKMLRMLAIGKLWPGSTDK